MLKPKLAGHSTGAPRTEERVPLEVAPESLAALRGLLFEPEMRGVGYSEFLQRAVAAAHEEIAELRKMRQRLITSARSHLKHLAVRPMLREEVIRAVPRWMKETVLSPDLAEYANRLTESELRDVMLEAFPDVMFACPAEEGA